MSTSKRDQLLPIASQSRLRPSVGMLSPPLTPEFNSSLPTSTPSSASSTPPRPSGSLLPPSSLRPLATAFLSPPTTPQKSVFPSVTDSSVATGAPLTSLTFPRSEHESPTHTLTANHIEPASSHSNAIRSLVAPPPPPAPRVLVLPDGFVHDTPPSPPRPLHTFSLHPLLAYRPPSEGYPPALCINFRSYMGIDRDFEGDLDDPATHPGRKHLRLVSSFLPMTIDISNPPEAPNEFITVRQVLDAVSYTLSQRITPEEWLRASREQRDRVFYSSPSPSPSRPTSILTTSPNHPRSSSSPPHHIPHVAPNGTAFGYTPHSSQTRLDFLGERTWFTGLRGDPSEIRRILGIGFSEEEGSLEEQVMSETLILMLSARPDGRE